jgi:hypothetical protein
MHNGQTDLIQPKADCECTFLCRPEKEDAEFKGEVRSSTCMRVCACIRGRLSVNSFVTVRVSMQVAKQNSVHAAKEVAKCLGKRLPSELKPEVSVVASIYNIEDGKVDILVSECLSYVVIYVYRLALP